VVAVDRLEKRELILDAALAVFSRRGVFATRIADIAEEAGVAYGLVYHYFKNKEEILNTIFEDRWTRLTERLEKAAAAGSNARERLHQVAAVFLEAYRSRPQLVELLLLEFTRMSKYLEPAQLERIGRAFAVVRRILERGQADGEIRPDIESELLVLVYLGSIQMIVQAQVLGAFREPEGFGERGAEQVVEVFLSGSAAR
jgi:AcrR family transcriptional regulator